MKINLLVIFEVDHNSNMKIFNLSIYCFSWWVLSMLIKNYHWIQKIFFFLNLWINCYQILYLSLMNLTAARFILLTNYLTINSDSPWNGLTKIQLLIYTDIFFSNIIDPRVVKMLTYCKKKEDEKMANFALFMLLTFSLFDSL